MQRAPRQLVEKYESTQPLRILKINVSAVHPSCGAATDATGARSESIRPLATIAIGIIQSAWLTVVRNELNRAGWYRALLLTKGAWSGIHKVNLPHMVIELAVRI